MSIASDLAHRGWSDQQIADAIVAWRRRHVGPDDPKIQRQKWLTHTIGKARASTAATEALQELQESEPVKVGTPRSEDAMAKDLEALSKIIGRRVLRWERNESDPRTYTMWFLIDEKELAVRFLSTSEVVGYYRFRARLYENGIVFTIPQKAWPAFLDSLNRVVVSVPDDDGSAHGRFESYLADYVSHTKYDDESSDKAIVVAAPFNRGGVWHVNVPDFLKFVHREYRDAMEPALMYQLLKSMGWSSKAYTSSGDDRKTKRYWSKIC